MGTETWVHKVLAAPDVPELVTPWPDDVADAVVEHLKGGADRHWGINAHRSLQLADTIIAIGRARDHVPHIALGTMARGDALKFLGHITDAWQALNEAGRLFAQIGDDVGWARTRIGRLLLCVDLNRVDEALADAERARIIFTTHKQWEKRLRLDHDTAYIYNLLGDHQRALDLYQAALGTAASLGGAGDKYLGTLYTNIGLAYDALGDLRQALWYHEQARTTFEHTKQVRHLAIAETNIALIAMTQGAYRRALRLLHRAERVYAAEHLDRDRNETNRLIADCYILLNRHAEARDLLQQVIAAYADAGATYEAAVAAVQLATAEAELGHFAAAHTALDQAQPVFRALGATSWEATARLRRGRIALQQGDHHTAANEAEAAAACFDAMGQQVPYAQAMILAGQAALAQGDLAQTGYAACTTLRIAQRCNVPGLRYTAHLLLGRMAEHHGNVLRAVRQYKAADATVQRMQRGLTIRLRPEFLEDKGEALRALIALRLRDKHTQRAFGALERAKGQVLLDYLANREHLRWATDGEHRHLFDELTHLREQHHQLYQAAHGTPGDTEAIGCDAPNMIHKLHTCERRMRVITEQLYLQGGLVARRTTVPSIEELRQHLDEAALVEYYNDGVDMWAFVLDQQTLTQHRLPITVARLDQVLAQLQINIAAALRLDGQARSMRALTGTAQRILQRLHAALLAPLAERVEHQARLIMVPYGALHYLPFHLLHNGATYVIEDHEVVILPAASMLGQRGPQRKGGALVLAHSGTGHLPQTLVEAEVVQHALGGTVLREHDARRAALDAPPCQVLHIAVHGEQRLDQPDLSYLALADGQLYADDLWQHDLSYELVTLSACETGRARVAPGDELVGLGQGLLYAGAGAVISSLWRVRDDAVVDVMDHMYRALREGVSKAAALQAAQRAVIHHAPHLHPAFWGAFKLVGDAAPLRHLPG